MDNLFAPRRPLRTLSEGIDFLDTAMNLVVYALGDLERHATSFAHDAKPKDVRGMKDAIDKIRQSFESAQTTADRLLHAI